jgi:hypothetical protein
MTDVREITRNALIFARSVLLIAIPSRWVRVPAILVIVGTMMIGMMSVGWFYSPTLVAAVWITLRGEQRPDP